MDIEEYVADLRARQAKVRPADTPSEVFYPLGELTLPEHLDHWAAERADTTAIAFEGNDLSYADVAGRVARVAGWLRAVGVGPGDRVAVFMANCPQFTITMMAILRIGAVHVPVNPMFHAAELEYELSDSGAEVVVTVDPLLPVLDAVRPAVSLRHVLVTGPRELAGDPVPPEVPERPDVTAWSVAERSDPAPLLATDLDALAALNYTGGTTGLPKGCQHTQRHMLYTNAASAGAAAQPADGTFVSLCYLPVFWIAGENFGILTPLVVGGTCVLLPRWEPRAALRGISTYGVTSMVGTVENYLELLARPDLAEHDLSTFTDPLAVSFVRKLTPDVRRDWAAAVGPWSLLREAAYGMTETHTSDTSPYGLADGDKDLLSEPVFCGIPVPGTDIAVVSFETGEPLPVGEAGEIIVRSPAVLTGYWNKPEATASQLRHGWLHTGDNGRIDEDGCLHYLGREKDMIKVKGMSVFPAEVEMLLTRHPAVQTVAVVPADDPEKGQVPVAFVSLVEPGAVDAGALQAWARETMAAYKVPLVRIVDRFPMTVTGKIRKVELVDEANRMVVQPT